MALPAIGDGEQIGDGNANETLNVGRSGQTVQVGGAASTLIAFHGATPVDQAATVAAVTTTAPVGVSGAFAFNTTAQYEGVINGLNAVIAALKEKGILANA